MARPKPFIEGRDGEWNVTVRLLSSGIRGLLDPKPMGQTSKRKDSLPDYPLRRHLRMSSRRGYVLLACWLGVVSSSAWGQCNLDSTTVDDDLMIARFVCGRVLCDDLRVLDDRRRNKIGHDAPLGSNRTNIDGFVADLAIRQVLAQLAFEQGLHQEPATAARLAQMSRRAQSEALDKSFSHDIEVSSQQIRRVFEQEPERTRAPEKIVSRFLLRKLPAGATDEQVAEVRRRLEDLRKQVLAGVSFSDLAKRHSEAENASRGGMVASSPKGRLLAAYEDVAWKLQPGEVSKVVRLSDGLALILLESVLPARQFSLEEATPRLRSYLEGKEQQRRHQVALAEARNRWPHRLTPLVAPSRASSDTPTDSNSDDRPVYLLDGRRLDLDAMGLGQHPPRLEERIAQALDRERMFLLAEHRFAEDPEVVQRITYGERDLLAKLALDRRIDAALPEASEETLNALYERHKLSKASPERRSFAVLFFPGERGQLRAVKATADAAAQAWRDTEEPLVGLEVERWGPLPRSTLGNSVSPRFAAAAFDLAIDEISPPLRLESYDSGSMRFRPEGYVVLRLVSIEAPSVPPFEQLRPELRRLAARRQRPAIEQKIRQDLLTTATFEMLEGPMAKCLEKDP